MDMRLLGYLLTKPSVGYDRREPDKKELLTYDSVDCCKHEEGLEDVCHQDSLHAAQS